MADFSDFSLMQRRLDAAQGKAPCDLILKNAYYLDVFSCEWRPGDLSIIDGTLVGLEPGLKAKQVLDCGFRKWVVPGFIDAHVHVESSMMDPFHFQKAVLPCGTTTAICDPHELANVLGLQGIEYFLEAAHHLDLDLWVMLSSCVPATQFETNGAGTISAEHLQGLASHSRVLGLAEVMNVPGVLAGDPDLLKKMQIFAHRNLDGHCPLLKGPALSAYASTGISSCHESSEYEEAREKLTKGISVWIREGSVAKDLGKLIPLLSLATSTSMGFCTDDRNPLDIQTEGHLDHLVRTAISKGVAPEVAFRTASWSVARHYGLTQGMSRVGAIAPGYQADLVVLDDVASCEIFRVLKKGRWSEEFEPSWNASFPTENSVRAILPEENQLQGPSGSVRVIGVQEGKILTEHLIQESTSAGVARLSVLERYGKGSLPANGYVRGFGSKLKGAIASSVGHDSHNLIAVGDNGANMKVAFKALSEMGGGFCIVENKNVIAHLPLPLGGLMTHRNAEDLGRELFMLKEASRSIGCELNEPFLQLAFLSLPVIPSLKLTDQGLVDVDRFQMTEVRAGAVVGE